MSVEKVRSIRRARPRYVTSGGELVPGVTTITGLRDKPALVNWAFNIARENPDLSSVREYVDDLARVGQCAHEIIAAHLKGGVADLSDFTKNEIDMATIPVRKFLMWQNGKKIKVILAEQPLVSDKYRYGGTLDLFANIDGKNTLIDWKTGKSGIYDEYRYQTSAYAKLLEEHGHRVDEIRIVRIGRNDNEGFAEETIGDWSNYWLAFSSLRMLYDVELAIRQGVPWEPKAA